MTPSVRQQADPSAEERTWGVPEIRQYVMRYVRPQVSLVQLQALGQVVDLETDYQFAEQEALRLIKILSPSCSRTAGGTVLPDDMRNRDLLAQHLVVLHRGRISETEARRRVDFWCHGGPQNVMFSGEFTRELLNRNPIPWGWLEELPHLAWHSPLLHVPAAPLRGFSILGNTVGNSGTNWPAFGRANLIWMRLTERRRQTAAVDVQNLAMALSQYTIERAQPVLLRLALWLQRLSPEQLEDMWALVQFQILSSSGPVDLAETERRSGYAHMINRPVNLAGSAPGPA